MAEVVTIPANMHRHSQLILWPHKPLCEPRSAALTISMADQMSKHQWRAAKN